MTDELKIKVSPQRLKTARIAAARQGILELIGSLHLGIDEAALSMIQAVGALIASQVTTHDEFQARLSQWARFLSTYAELNKESLERAIKESRGNAQAKSN